MATDVKKTRSVVLKQFGDYRNVHVCDWFLYNVKDGFDDNNVEIEVSYCGVNFADIYLRKGLIPTVNLPCILGLECVGIVKRIGSRVDDVKVGDRVLCYRGSGGLYRHTVVLPDYCCFQIPAYIPDEIAVALPANYLTAYFCLFIIGNIKPGNQILIHSCVGGVGWAATQLAKSVDSVRIFGTASPAKWNAAYDNGVHYVISSNDYYRHMLDDSELKDQKFDIIIDTLGCSNTSLSLGLLKPFGKNIIIGANESIIGDERFHFWDYMKLLVHNKSISASNLIMNSVSVAGLNLDQLLNTDPCTVRQVMQNIFDLFKKKIIQPKIDSIWSFEQVLSAMELLSTRQNIGKVIMKV